MHYEEASGGQCTTAYEVPVPQSLPEENIYELGPDSEKFSNSEIVYELTEANIYATPDLPSQVRAQYCRSPYKINRSKFFNFLLITLHSKSGTQDATFIELPPDYEDLYEQVSIKLYRLRIIH